MLRSVRRYPKVHLVCNLFHKGFSVAHSGLCVRLNVRKNSFMQNTGFQIVSVAGFRTILPVGTATIKCLIQNVVTLAAGFNLDQHCSATVCTANDSFEDVLIFRFITRKTSSTAVKDSLYVLPTFLRDDCFMRVRDDGTFCKRNITPLLGFHRHSGFCFIDDVSGVDRAVQDLTDIGRIPIIHLFIIDKAVEHLFLVVARLQDFLIVKPLGDAVKPQTFLCQ